MRKILVIIVLINSVAYGELLEKPKSYNGVEKAGEALLAYPAVAKKANFLAWKLKQMTLGEELADKVLVLSPLVTGRVEFSMMDFDIELDYLSEKGVVRYVYKF